MVPGRPRVDDDVKKARGTWRGDRVFQGVDRDEGEEIPKLPKDLKGHAAKFWRRHAQDLWDDGWLCRKTADGFILACRMYAEYMELQEYIAENGAYYELTRSQSEKQPYESPQSKRYHELERLLFKVYGEMGITSTMRRRALSRKAEEPKDPDRKPSLLEFTKQAK